MKICFPDMNLARPGLGALHDDAGGTKVTVATVARRVFTVMAWPAAAKTRPSIPTVAGIAASTPYIFVFVIVGVGYRCRCRHATQERSRLLVFYMAQDQSAHHG